MPVVTMQKVRSRKELAKLSRLDGIVVKMPKGFKLRRAEEIANLPWFGNAASDVYLFWYCEQYTKSQASKREQKRAMFLTGKFGMGIVEKVSDRDLQEYLASM